MPKYKYLFTDLDDTLFDSSSLYDQAIYMAWEQLRKFYPEITFEDFQSTFLAIRKDLKEKYKYKTLSHQRALLFMKLLEHYKIPFDATDVLELTETYWFCVNVYIQTYPGTYETLEKIKKSGMGIVAISDGNMLDRLEKISTLGLSKYINYLVCSEEVVDTKPMPRVFDLALEKTGCEKDEVIFVGNSFSADVVGGENFGIDTVWFNIKKKEIPKDAVVKPDYEIESMEEILPILGIDANTKEFPIELPRTC
jgi:HAD superfamily hydrolase (TIGR01549 family)